MPVSFTDSVKTVMESLKPGDVVTYKEVAEQAGYPGAARAVGTLLSRGTHELPWWRVVTTNGRLVPGAEAEQARLLAKEGIKVARGHVHYFRASRTTA